MKTPTNTFRSRIAAGIACLAALIFTTANAARAEPKVSSDELAVWQAAAGVVARDYPARPYKVWYFQSDFTSASFIATALIDPDRRKGLRPVGTGSAGNSFPS